VKRQLFWFVVRVHRVLHGFDQFLHRIASELFRAELAEREAQRKLLNLQEVWPRVFEYAFAIKHSPEKGAIMEVGCTASANVVPIMLAERGHEVFGVDLRRFKVKHASFHFVMCDARHLPFQPNVFQSCYSISTIEHVGLKDPDGDLRAVREMVKSVRPEGSLVITIPFGKLDMLPDARIYDAQDTKRLFAGLTVANEEYIMERNGAWLKTTRDEASKADYRARCRAVAMLELKNERHARTQFPMTDFETISPSGDRSRLGVK